MTNIREVLARNMKAYRGAAGLSQAKLAEKVETSAHYIGMIETKNNFPSPEMLERIAGALGIDTIDLFSMGKSLPEAMRAYRKAALKDIEGVMGRFIEERLRELERDPPSGEANGGSGGPGPSGGGCAGAAPPQH
jgi:transcriptional regulator with XRE-family HTH domain